MPFEPGRSGNPGGRPKERPFRDALRIEQALAERGEDTPAKKGSLRYIARRLLERAAEETTAAREVADRLDGKVPQGHEHAGRDGGPIQAVTAEIDLTKATDEQLTALEAIFGPLAAAGADDGGDREGEGEA